MKTEHWSRIAPWDLVGQVASVGTLRGAPRLEPQPRMQALGIKCVQGGI